MLAFSLSFYPINPTILVIINADKTLNIVTRSHLHYSTNKLTIYAIGKNTLETKKTNPNTI